jgi:putative redox protein
MVVIKASARRTDRDGFTHQIELRQHRLTGDEPLERGGGDQGPTPLELLAASLATCTAVTLEMYAQHKGWDLGAMTVEAEYSLPERGSATCFRLLLRLPADLAEEQVRRLEAIAARCPVHRVLEGEVRFEERIELVEPAVLRG